MDLTKKDLTKEEILQATRSSDVWKWIQNHPDEDHTEAAKLFNELCRKEFERDFPKEYAPGTHLDLSPLY